MARRTTVRRVLPELPFHLDALDADLDNKYRDIRTPIQWGMVVGAVNGPWSESVQVPGVDWVLRLAIPGDLKLPTLRTGRLSWRGVRQHCGIAVALIGANTPNEARDAGRPAVRALLAILRRSYRQLILSNTIWEGPVTCRRQDRLMCVRIPRRG